MYRREKGANIVMAVLSLHCSYVYPCVNCAVPYLRGIIYSSASCSRTVACAATSLIIYSLHICTYMYIDCSIQWSFYYCLLYTVYTYICVTVFLFAGASRPPPGFSTSHKEHLPMTDSVWGPAEQRPLGKPCCVCI